MSHETAPTSGATEADAPLYVVLGTHKTAMSFASARKIGNRDVIAEHGAVERIRGLLRPITLVFTADSPLDWRERDRLRIHVEMLNHTYGRPTNEIVYR